MSRTRLATSAFFFINGALYATWVSRIPAVKEDLVLSEADLGLALLALAAGTIAALPAVTLLLARHGEGATATGSALLCGLTLALAGVAPTLGLTAAALFAFGLGMGGMDVSMNAQAARQELAGGRSIMSSFHGVWSLGGLLGALAGAACAGGGISRRLHLAAAGALLVAATLAARRHLPPSTATASPGPVLAWPGVAVLNVGLIAVCGALVEGGIADWSGVYMREDLAAGAALAAGAYAAFSAAMMLGRFGGDALIDHLGAPRVLRSGALFALLGLAAMLASRHPVVAICGLFAAGLGLSTVFPIAFSAAGRLPGGAPGASIAAVATLGYGASLLGPPAIGFAAEATSLRAALAALVVLAALLAVLAGRLGQPVNRER